MDFGLFRKYALMADPTTLPVYYKHTEHTLTIFDAFPKSSFHFLVLPRLVPPTPYTETQLHSLHSLMSLSGLKEEDKVKMKAVAKECLENIEKTAQALKEEIEKEMLDRFDFVWDVWTGFHSVQSMDHLHLHVMSADLNAPGMKTMKHYNSFHPELGYFLHLKDVLDWFDADPSYYQQAVKLERTIYRKKLKEPLECFYKDCAAGEFKFIPQLKAHLNDHFLAAQVAGKKKIERRRKFEEADLKRKKRALEGDGAAAEDGRAQKRQTTEEKEET